MDFSVNQELSTGLIQEPPTFLFLWSFVIQHAVQVGYSIHKATNSIQETSKKETSSTKDVEIEDNYAEEDTTDFSSDNFCHLKIT